MRSPKRILLIMGADVGDYDFGGGQRENNLRDALLEIGDVDTIIWRGSDPPLIKDDWGPERIKAVGLSSNASRMERVKALLAVRKLISSADRSENYDLIVVRFFPKTLAVPFRAHHKLVVDADDLRANDLDGSFRKRLLHLIRSRLFGWIGSRSRHVWCVDPRDTNNAIVPLEKGTLLPNTAKQPQPRALQKSPFPRLLMVGVFAYPPNGNGLLWFVRNVLPKLSLRFPDLQLHAVGKYFQAELAALSEPVFMRGFVPDLDAEYASSDVVICPIFTGSGTQTKVIEALMHGRPTVVSSFSYLGFSDILQPNEHLLVADTPDEFAEKIAAVIDHPERYAAMAKAGQQAAQAAYSISAFREHVLTTINGLQQPA